MEIEDACVGDIVAFNGNTKNSRSGYTSCIAMAVWDGRVKVGHLFKVIDIESESHCLYVESNTYSNSIFVDCFDLICRTNTQGPELLVRNYDFSQG